MCLKRVCTKSQVTCWRKSNVELSMASTFVVQVRKSIATGLKVTNMAGEQLSIMIKHSLRLSVLDRSMICTALILCQHAGWLVEP